MIISNEDSTIEINEPSPKPNTNLHNSQFDPTTPYSEKRMNQRNTDTDDMSTTSGVEYNMRRTGSSHSHGSNRQKQNLVDINLPDESESIIGEELQLSPISLSLILHPSDTQVSSSFSCFLIVPVRSNQLSTTDTLNQLRSIPIQKVHHFHLLQFLLMVLKIIHKLN